MYWSWYSYGNTAYFSTKRANANLRLRYTASNTCRAIHKDFTFTTGSCPIMIDAVQKDDLGLKISPNPATNLLSLSLKTDDEERAIREVIIQNKTGREVKRLRLNTRSQAINVSDLPSDIYILQVFDGKNWINRKFIKQ